MDVWRLIWRLHLRGYMEYLDIIKGILKSFRRRCQYELSYTTYSENKIYYMGGDVGKFKLTRCRL